MKVYVDIPTWLACENAGINPNNPQARRALQKTYARTLNERVQKRWKDIKVGVRIGDDVSMLMVHMPTWHPQRDLIEDFVDNEVYEILSGN